MTSRPLAAVLLLSAAAIALAQTAPATGPAPKPLSPLRITLMDGSSVSGKLSVNELAIDTKFGSLKVPVDQIKSFAPGLKSHPEFEKKLSGLIADLSAEAFADREKAQEQLIALGMPIKAELERALKTAESEREMRLTKILEDFESTNTDDAPVANAWVADDVIVTEGFTVVGHITTDSFSVSSPYGTLQLKLADVREGRRDGLEPEELRKTIAVAGSSIGNHNFTTTGVRLNRGDQVQITATGSIQMTPFGGNQQSGPDGGNNFGQMQPENIPGGSLIGRIGKGGEVLRIGSKSTFTASKAGPLELGIAMNGDFAGNAFPGEYSVKIRVVRKP